MEKIKEIAGSAAITLLFSLMTIGLTASYIEEYNFLSTKPAAATAIEKIGGKGLFSSPAYYVKVELPNGEEAPHLNRISKKQMTEIEAGDPVYGYSAHSSDFSTLRDIIVDSLFFLFGILVLGFLSLCCLVAFVYSLPIWGRPPKKNNPKREKKVKRKKEKSREERERTGWRIVAVAVLVFLFFLGRTGLNLFRKVMPFGKTKTEAVIVDNYSYFSYRKHEDSAYELTISFKDAAGQNIQVIKDVTRHTYNQFGIGDKLPISYRNENPYDVFVRGNDVWDILQIALTWEFYMYAAFIAVIVFVGWVFFKDRRKENSK